MSIDLHVYGSQDPIQFKLTLNGVGVEPVLEAADIKLFKDGVYSKDIGAIVTPITGGGVTGVYKWTPAAIADTQAKILTLVIKDQVGTAFDENTIIISTGGNAAARFRG